MRYRCVSAATDGTKVHRSLRSNNHQETKTTHTPQLLLQMRHIYTVNDRTADQLCVVWLAAFKARERRARALRANQIKVCYYSLISGAHKPISVRLRAARCYHRRRASNADANYSQIGPKRAIVMYTRANVGALI